MRHCTPTIIDKSRSTAGQVFWKRGVWHMAAARRLSLGGLQCGTEHQHLWGLGRKKKVGRKDAVPGRGKRCVVPSITSNHQHIVLLMHCGQLGEDRDMQTRL
jgi:hypothetical protein